jgi:hypothetical protein
MVVQKKIEFLAENSVSRIRIDFMRNADPDPALKMNADPDPNLGSTFKKNKFFTEQI